MCGGREDREEQCEQEANTAFWGAGKETGEGSEEELHKSIGT